MNKPLAAIILAAGKGTRMDSDLPKVLHKVGGRAMIVHVIHTARNLGTEKNIAVLGYKYEIVQKALENESVECALQLKQLGTAHAVMQSQDLLSDFQGNVLILYGDVPLIKIETLSRLMEVHEIEGAWSTILTTDLPDPTGYGRIIREKGKVAIDKINNYVEIQGVNNIEQLDEVNEFYKND